MSGKSTMRNFKSMLAEAKLPEKTVQICLRGDLVAEYEQLERHFEELQQNSSSLDGGGIGDVAEQMEAIRALMLGQTYDFRVRALPRPEFRKLVNDHPPRQTAEGTADDRDRYIGVNVDTFFDALIRQCVSDPVLEDEDWADLLNNKLTDKQYDALSDAAWSINRSDVDIPFSRAASRMSQGSAAA